jgi:hypothetical protein
MPDHLAYELTEDFADAVGGTIAGPDGTTIDLIALRDDDATPSGLIVTADEFTQISLDADFRFKRAALPSDWAPPGDQLDAGHVRKARKTDLQDLYAQRFGHPAPDDATVPRLQHALMPDEFPDPDAGGDPPGQTPLDPDGTPADADGDGGEE